MISESNAALTSFLSFANPVKCARLIKIRTTDDLEEYFDEKEQKDFLILGGASNILIIPEFLEKDILLIELPGKDVVVSEKEYDLIEFGAGENWHEVVLWSLNEGYGGLENLSLIPGTVGAAPIQNIGAYGVEIKDVLHSVRLFDLDSKKIFTLHNSECDFKYRDSIFKNSLKGSFVITSVTLKLSKQNHNINTSYGAILKEIGDEVINPVSISQAVVKIRNSKLPDPKVLGNSGSFFKNPIISIDQLERLQVSHPEIPFYPITSDETKAKVPAAWLIEQSGFKGKRFGDVGFYEKHALVLVNYAAASGAELWEHAMRVQSSVLERFGIKLQPEVNLIQ